MRRAACLVALLLSAAGPVAAQGTGAIELGAGAAYHGQSDRAASPLQYVGMLPGIRLARRWEAPRARWTLRAGFAAGTLHSRATMDGLPSEDIWTGYLTVRHLRQVGRALNSRVTLWVGGELAAHGSLRVHRYPVVGTEPFADVLVPLSAVGAWEWQTGPIRAGQRLSVSVLGLAVRTPYGGLKYSPRLDIAPGWELTTVDQELYVERSLGRRFGVRASWSVTYLRHPNPRELRMAAHRVIVSGVLFTGVGR